MKLIIFFGTFVVVVYRAVSDLCTCLVDGLLETAEKSSPASDVAALKKLKTKII